MAGFESPHGSGGSAAESTMPEPTCPECGSTDVDRQTTWHNGETVDVTYVCLDCPTQFTLSYGNPEVVSTLRADEVGR